MAVRTDVRATGEFTRTTVQYNPEENGIAERVNRTLLEGTRYVLATSNLPDEY